VSRRGRTPLLARALSLAALLALATAHAETLYVVEQLVVNVNSAPDASGERIATVKSGEGVELLERQGEQVHVRLAGGREGWIRAGYLSAAAPLRVQLAQRDAEVARLQEEMKRLAAQPAVARSPAAGAAAPTAAAPTAAASPAADSPAAPPTAAAEDPGNSSGMLFGGSAAEQPVRAWPWALGGALLGLAIGFALGVVLLDRHIRRKYGGLRIY
jgi:SH3 domain-containing protein